MSALPKQVKKQIAEAQQIVEAIEKARANDGTEVGKEIPEPPKSESDGAAPAPEAPPETTEAAPESPSPAPEANEWEHKYNVLQGKYNAEVPRMQRRLNDAMAQINQLSSELAVQKGLVSALGQRKDAPASSEETVTAPPTRLIKDDEIKEFGPDLYNFIQRAAQEVVARDLDKFMEPVKKKVAEVSRTANKVERDTAQTKQERMYALLDSEFPEWSKVNDSEPFLNWLDEVDPYTGSRRGELMKKAVERADGPRVVAFFKGFQREHTVVAPAASAAPAPAANAQVGTQKKLDEYVAPGKAKTGTTEAPEEGRKRTWTESEVNAFYEKVRKGKFRDASEREKIERDIVAAAREGRYVLGR